MHGLTLNFKYPPSSYEEDNNQSAKSNLPAVREKVKSWVADGHVTELDTKPFCCITLSLITKIDNSTGKIKHWPCIDMSRYLNPLSLDDPIKLDDLSVAEHLVDRNDFMASLDLKNMFFHVQLHPEFKKYFGFKLPNEDGTDQYYQFTVMAYGIKPAVSTVTRLLKPVKAYLHSLGVKFSIYIDDGRVLASTSVSCWDQFEAAKLILSLAGWNLQMAKTSTKPVQSLQYLGFITDTVSMRYFAPPEKLTLIASTIKECLARIENSQPFLAREISSILGKLHALSNSHGNCVYMCRATQHQLGLRHLRRQENHFLQVQQ